MLGRTVEKAVCGQRRSELWLPLFGLFVSPVVAVEDSQSWGGHLFNIVPTSIDP